MITVTQNTISEGAEYTNDRERGNLNVGLEIEKVRRALQRSLVYLPERRSSIC